MGYTWNDIRRRAGIMEAGDPEILPPGSTLGDDAVDPQEAMREQIMELETAQERQMMAQLASLGWSEEDISVIVSFSTYGERPSVDYNIQISDAYNLNVAMMMEFLKQGLVATETKISGTSKGEVWLQTEFPASETVFAQFITR